MQDHARGQQPFRRSGAQQLFHAGKLQRRIDAQQAVVPSALHAAHSIILRQPDEVGDVILATLVIVTQTRQQAFHGGQAELVHARVDLAAFRAMQGRIIILGFHNAEHPPLLAHHPAIRAGIVQHNGGEGQLRAGGFGQKVAHQRFGKQGGIAVDHQQVGAARCGKRGQSLHQRMPCAKLLGLKDQTRIRKGGLHHFSPVAHHHPDVFSKNRPQGRAHIRQHGLAQQRLQHLGTVRMHAGALARRQNKSRVFRHKNSP